MGCAGVVAISERNNQSINPVIARNAGVIHNGSKYNKTYTAAQVLTLWGEPNEKRVSESDPEMEIWIYNTGMGWSGIFIMAVVVPIPVLAPVGQRTTILTIKNKEVVYGVHHFGGINPDATFVFPEYGIQIP